MSRWFGMGLVAACVWWPAAAMAQAPDPDRPLNPAQPDFTLGALPTTLRLPARAFGFRLTHRFARPIASGSVGDFFADFFGMDGAARIGLELRYGVWPGTQVAAHRTNDRAIQILGQSSVVRQHDAWPVAIDAIGAVEGADNFTEDYAGTVGAVVSHVFRNRGAIYAQPFVVFNTDLAPGSAQDWTAVIGFGARLRLGQSRVYLVAEAAPQVGGYDAGVDHVSVGIERRAGHHMFQLTVSNALGTTFRQIARGGANSGDWYIGFNLTRRFY